MLKTVVAGAAALVLVAGVAVRAETGTADSQTAAAEAHGLAEDHGAFVSARVAALHAGLLLTPDQEKAWPAFEKAYRELAEVRDQHLFHAHDGESLDPLQRAQRRADTLAAHSTASRHYADALAPLYQTLDDGQKRRFALLQHFGHPRFHHFGLRRAGEPDGGHDEFHRGGFHHGDFHHGESAQ